MTLSKTIDNLKEETLIRYLSKSEVHWYNTPEYFSPLYRKFIANLIEDKEPEGYKEKFLEQSIDVQNELINDECYKNRGVLFDRYLLCIYPARYEPSNPRKLKDYELNEKGLLSYLQKEYGRSSIEHQSFQLSREIEGILQLLPYEDGDVEGKKIKEKYKVEAKSSCFKLVVLKHKLSLINKKWMELIRYREPNKANQASMDNIVDFNMSSDEHAKLNTALIKRFYFEIDEGKGAGDDTYSFRINQVPYYLRVLEEQVKQELWVALTEGRNIESIKDKILNRFDVCKSEVVGGLVNHHYKDYDQKLMDHLQHTILVNQFSNSFLAENELIKLCSDEFFTFSHSTDWLTSNNENERIEGLKNELGISENEFKKEWVAMARTLARMLALTNKTLRQLMPTIQMNICILILAILKSPQSSRNTAVKSKIAGSSKNNYSIYNDLKKAHDWIIKNDPDLRDKHSISKLRPTSLSFFKAIYEEIYYSLVCSVEGKKASHCTFNKMRLIHFDIVSDLLGKLRKQSHLYTIWIIESYYVKKRNGELGPQELPLSLNVPGSKHGFWGIIEHHIINTEWGSALESVKERHSVTWNPISWMKEQVLESNIEL
ncbi:hypothetical protein CWC25_02125 [Pseudoalteromonas sp. S4389]|uniref:hypothetical protein n=1 Tax=Pseudoalteromonas sp. S4389 TaxID=579556 RepID=UPI001107B97B|nr:hypothetical protein [Pseudoalteromonas sp. S4389]TMO47069.1 hypothetical protein CWC25_02125 [Pseudoalteromonas sp. S4389]